MLTYTTLLKSVTNNSIKGRFHLKSKIYKSKLYNSFIINFATGFLGWNDPFNLKWQKQQTPCPMPFPSECLHERMEEFWPEQISHGNSSLSQHRAEQFSQIQPDEGNINGHIIGLLQHLWKPTSQNTYHSTVSSRSKRQSEKRVCILTLCRVVNGAGFPSERADSKATPCVLWLSDCVLACTPDPRAQTQTAQRAVQSPLHTAPLPAHTQSTRKH